MLTRVANSLYWTGRYLERTEHLSRYLKVQYFSTLDATMSQRKPFVLRSILNMVSIPYGDEEIIEEEVLYNVALNFNNPASIISSVFSGRENARGVRDVISTELWESINKYYHFVNNYPIETYKTRGLYDFATNCIEHCAVVRANMDNTLLHDDIWAIMRLGIHVERATQIARIITNKLYDISLLLQEEQSNAIEAYQWTTLLKMVESFDMSRRFYKKPPNASNTLEFLIMNRAFPRSISYNLHEIKYYIDKINHKKLFVPGTLHFQSGKMASKYTFMEKEEFMDDSLEFMHSTRNEINKLHEMIQKEYLDL